MQPKLPKENYRSSSLLRKCVRYAEPPARSCVAEKFVCSPVGTGTLFGNFFENDGLSFQQCPHYCKSLGVNAHASTAYVSKTKHIRHK